MGIYDAFETKEQAMQSARALGGLFGRVSVRRLNPPEAGGRLKWGVFASNF